MTQAEKLAYNQARRDRIFGRTDGGSIAGAEQQ
jgi:hypothetical protein